MFSRSFCSFLMLACMTSATIDPSHVVSRHIQLVAFAFLVLATVFELLAWLLGCDVELMVSIQFELS